jgi:uncharacterized phiE125 gp8 family phage protein
MALRKLTDATIEPVSLAEARAHLRAATTAEDALITSLITAARQACEDRLQRTLLQTDWELTLDAFPCAIPLRMPSVMSVQSVQYVDEDGATQTLSPSSYQVDTKSEPGWIVPAYGYAWPTTREQINAVTVAYRCGYGTTAAAVPGPLKSWILLMVGSLYENRESFAVAQGIVSVELGFADRLLDTYRVWAI